MRLEGLFEILSHNRECDGHTFGVRLDGSHPVFAGHFPGNPVLPGVCSMYIVKECAGQVLGSKLSYAAVKECKFLSAVLPDRHSDLSISLSLNEGEEGQYNITAEIKAGEETMVKIKAALQEK